MTPDSSSLSTFFNHHFTSIWFINFFSLHRFCFVPFLLCSACYFASLISFFYSSRCSGKHQPSATWNELTNCTCGNNSAYIFIRWNQISISTLEVIEWKRKKEVVNERKQKQNASFVLLLFLHFAFYTWHIFIMPFGFSFTQLQ